MKSKSIFSSILDVDECVEIFIFANTPLSLFTKVKNSRSYSRIKVSNLENSVLLEAIKSLDTSDESLEELSTCYLLIIYLLSSRGVVAKTIEDAIAEKKIKWIKDLVRISFNEVKAQNNYSVTYPIPFIPENKITFSGSAQRLEQTASPVDPINEFKNSGETSTNFIIFNSGAEK